MRAPLSLPSYADASKQAYDGHGTAPCGPRGRRRLAATAVTRNDDPERAATDLPSTPPHVRPGRPSRSAQPRRRGALAFLFLSRLRANRMRVFR